jgi:hypothetical protein
VKSCDLSFIMKLTTSIYDIDFVLSDFWGLFYFTIRTVISFRSGINAS